MSVNAPHFVATVCAVGLRVLIADDDPVAREVLRRALDADGVVVVGTASDGREAIPLVRELGAEVVLMDVVMADMDGVEATRRIAAAHPGVDCVLLTATPTAEASETALAAGAAAYLPKSLLGLGRLPATLQALRADEASVRRRRTRRLALGLRRAWPALLDDREWLRLELAAAGEHRHDVDDLLELLESTGDPRVEELGTVLATD